MWSTVIATAVAASVCLSLVNVAAEMSRIRDARSVVDPALHQRAVPAQQIPGAEAQTVSGPGA